MTTHLDGQAGFDPLDDFPKEIREHLQAMKGTKVPQSLVNRITERALSIDYHTPDPGQNKVGSPKATASRLALVYTSGVLAATAFLTLGLLSPWYSKDPKQTTIQSGSLPQLSTVAQSPLPQWDKQLLEQSLMQIKDQVDQTDEKIQIQNVREDLVKVLETFKR